MGDNRNPFKGPFKGKGANRLALRDLEQELQEISDEMDEAIASFNAVFKSPRPILLRKLGKRSYPLLWWRMPGRSGTYIKLFDLDNAAGAKVLKSLMNQTINTLCDFDRIRIRQNFRASIVGNAAEAYKRRERELECLDKFNT